VFAKLGRLRAPSCKPECVCLCVCLSERERESLVQRSMFAKLGRLRDPPPCKRVAVSARERVIEKREIHTHPQREREREREREKERERERESLLQRSIFAKSSRLRATQSRWAHQSGELGLLGAGSLTRSHRTPSMSICEYRGTSLTRNSPPPGTSIGALVIVLL